MENQNELFTAFADAVEMARMSLAPKLRSLVGALAERSMGGLKAFPQRTDRFHLKLDKCLSEREFVALQVISQAASVEQPWLALLATIWDGDKERIAHFGDRILNGSREQLDDLVSLVVPGGWESLGMGALADQELTIAARAKIAKSTDAYWKCHPDWLRLPSGDAYASTEAPDAVQLPVPTNTATSCEPSSAPTSLLNLGSTHDAAELDRMEPDRTKGVITSLREILAQPIQRRRLVFGPMVEHGVVTLMAAAPGVGKTMLSIQIACAVASGRDWAGFAVKRPGRVIYVNAEDSAEEVARRFAAARLAGLIDEDAAERISVLSRSDHRLFAAKQGGVITATQYGEWLRRAVATIQPTMIIIDPMAMTHTLDENNNADMAWLAGFFASLASFGDAGVLVIHHAGKDAKDGLGSARGASSIVASVRSMWSLQAASAKVDHLSVQLTCVKSNHHPTGAAHSFRRVQQMLENGDTVGLLQPVSDTGPTRNG